LGNLIKLLELQMCYLNNWKVSLARDNYSWMKLNISEYKTWNEFDLFSDGKFRPDPPKEVGLKMSGLKSNVILEN
jgi:hypothetical protein